MPDRDFGQRFKDNLIRRMGGVPRHELLEARTTTGGYVSLIPQADIPDDQIGPSGVMTSDYRERLYSLGLKREHVAAINRALDRVSYDNSGDSPKFPTVADLRNMTDEQMLRIKAPIGGSPNQRTLDIVRRVIGTKNE